MDYQYPPPLPLPEEKSGSVSPQERNGIHGTARDVETSVVAIPGAHRDESLRETLTERHVNMIAFSGTIGIGIFLTSGKILHYGGPGGAILAYTLTGTVIWSVIASLGEMTALMPVKGPITEFSTRYVDSAVGFATGWMYWFAYVTVFAAQVTASSSLMQFNYDNVIAWAFGINISLVLWIFIFLVYMTGVNLLPVRIYGEFEYICGCLKMITITGLILIMVIITNGSSSLPNGDKIGDRYWKGHWGFFARSFTVTAHKQQFVYTGDTGRLYSIWSAMTTAIFSYIGMDIVAATAAETKNFGNSESIKIATRKISLRILLLYFFAIVAQSFPVAYDDHHLVSTNHGLKTGASSPFMVAIVNAGIPVLPHILNAFFIFSSSSAGINALYVASRTLHALAVEGRVLDGIARKRLKLTVHGVPMVAVFVSASFGLLAFMATKTAPSKVLLGLISNSSVSIMIVYGIISLAFICFYNGLDAAGIDRENPSYPHRSHLQWVRAVYACFGCFLFVFFNGWQSFIGGAPIPADQFLPAYISIFVFLFLIFIFKVNMAVRFGGTWGRDVNKLYEGSQTVEKGERRGQFRVPEPKDAVAFVREVARFTWVWVV